MSHYHFGIDLRIRHPEADPSRITDALGIMPRSAWKAGERRRTPTGTPLQGLFPATYWYAEVFAGRYPNADLAGGIQSVLSRLAGFREFFNSMRSEGGSIELFIGWFFERQSADVFTHDTLAKAADLQMDLSFDV